MLRTCLLCGLTGFAAWLPAQEGGVSAENPNDESLLGSSRAYLGGWLDFAYSDNQAGDPEWDIPHLYLYLDATLSRRWRGFFEVSHLTTSRFTGVQGEGETQVERAYLEYRLGIPFKLRLGRYNTPAGLWQQMRWSFTVDTTRKPVIEEKHYFPIQSEGLELLGKKTAGHVEWDYSLFLSNGGENREGASPRDDRLGFGADASVNLYERWKTGLFFNDFRSEGGPFDREPGDRKAYLVYSEISLFSRQLLWRSEYLFLDRGAESDISGYYSKLKWQPRQEIYLNYRFDFADDLIETTIVEHRVHTLTLGYRPLKHLRGRLEFAHHEQLDRGRESYREWSLWLGYMFR